MITFTGDIRAAEMKTEQYSPEQGSESSTPGLKLVRVESSDVDATQQRNQKRQDDSSNALYSYRKFKIFIEFCSHRFFLDEIVLSNLNKFRHSTKSNLMKL